MIASIDFGASSTKAAVLEPGGAALNVLFADATQFPTAVYLTPKGDILVGAQAIRSRGRNPHRLSTELKQHVNRAVTDRATRQVLRLGNDELRLVDGVAAILRHAYAAVRALVEGHPGQVVLTHPVTWGEPQRALLREAAGRAGIHPVLHLVNEPEAAIRHVLARVRADLPAPIAVLDVGASTSDLAVLTRREDGRLVPLFQDGVQAGGDDLDAGVLDHVASRLSASGLQAFTTLRERHSYEAWTVARQTKHELSALPRSGFSLEFEGMPDVPITREEFAAATEDIVEECLAPLEHAIEVLRGSNPVRSVVLSGGSSSVPAVREEAERLARTAGAAFLRVGGEAETAAVALGAVRAVGPYELRMKSKPVFTLPPDSTLPVETKKGFAYKEGKSRIRTHRQGQIPSRAPGVTVGNFTAFLWSLGYDAATETLISGTDDGLVQLWTIGDDGALNKEGFVGRTMSVLGTLRGQSIIALARLRDWIAWYEHRGTGAIYRRQDGTWLKKAEFQSASPVEAVVFIDSPHRLVVWSRGRIALHSPDTGALLSAIEFDPPKDGAAFDPFRGRVYVAGGGTLTCYRVQPKKLTAEFEVPFPAASSVGIGRSSGGRTAVLAFNPKESELIAVDGLTGAVLARRAAELKDDAAMVSPVRDGHFLILSGLQVFRLELERADA